MKNGGSKRKLTSPLGGVVLLLSIASIFSIGFSSWNIGNPSASANIDIKADDASKKIVIKLIESSLNFQIGPDGLVVDSTIAKSGTLTFSFSIFNENASPFLFNDGKVHILVALECSKNSGFLTYVNSTPSCYSFGTNISFPNSSVSANSSSLNGIFKNSISLPLNDEVETKFDVEYTIKDDSNGTIKNYYDKLPELACFAEMEEEV